MILLFWNDAQTSPPSSSIVTGNPIGLLLALTYTVEIIPSTFVTPDCRILFIRAENRVLSIPRENRVLSIPKCQDGGGL